MSNRLKVIRFLNKLGVVQKICKKNCINMQKYQKDYAKV